jgi:hypothetical protein
MASGPSRPSGESQPETNPPDRCFGRVVAAYITLAHPHRRPREPGVRLWSTRHRYVDGVRGLEKRGRYYTSDVIAFLKDSHVLAGQSSAVSANDAIQTARATGPKFVKPGSNSEIGGRLLAV